MLRLRIAGALAGLGIASAAIASACSPPPRDVVPETKDVVVEGADASSSATAKPGAYLHVARRRHGTIALSGRSPQVPADDAQRFVDRLADELDACAARLEVGGTLVDGAARMVIASSAMGTGLVGDTELQAGGGVAANALLCIAAPAKTIPLVPRPDGGPVPAILIDATWGPVQGGNAVLPGDAGSADAQKSP
jgi:hypothetical protein